ncbi:hypothetical protein ABTL16_19845, partial [Acinetobacter baumannii]
MARFQKQLSQQQAVTLTARQRLHRR